MDLFIVGERVSGLYYTTIVKRSAFLLRILHCCRRPFLSAVPTQSEEWFLCPRLSKTPNLGLINRLLVYNTSRNFGVLENGRRIWIPFKYYVRTRNEDGGVWTIAYTQRKGGAQYVRVVVWYFHCSNFRYSFKIAYQGREAAFYAYTLRTVRGGLPSVRTLHTMGGGCHLCVYTALRGCYVRIHCTYLEGLRSVRTHCTQWEGLRSIKS